MTGSQATTDDLRVFPLLNALEAEQREEALAHSRIVQVERGEQLFRQGEPARRIWLCRSGQLKLFRLSSDGHEKIVAIIQPGRSFAEATMFLPERRYPVNCAALKPSELVGFDADALVATLRESPDACFRLLGTLSCRIQEKINQIESLALQNAHLRVAHYLLDVYRQQESRGPFRLEASKKHIAGLLAIQPETLSRSLAILQNNGVIDMQARRITVRAPEELQQIARGSSQPRA
ncbi:Crp/Fnr family transcriptional regulator [Wenzhouxiangella sp. AB-CW3]|uniref:Crp/Fnr family transcriptional regulator n=1 Tax=Wenzhouxiangella sp. AB-CW3 TaxID=2771012 RepID=UPI00168B5BB9|nr:Crp/Fnr family transcriptional regulator [Wenzhouxiangella sp. AB-CW3]QOC22508.1 Crp/Fnr family transcriptional regulator [Wenzhouxiangella sp. AB-CW3]